LLNLSSLFSNTERLGGGKRMKKKKTAAIFVFAFLPVLREKWWGKF